MGGAKGGRRGGRPPARGPAPTWVRTKGSSSRGGGAGGPRAGGGRLPGSPRLPPRLRLPGPAATKMARWPGCGLADESRRQQPAGTASRSGQVEAAAGGGRGQLLAGARARLGPRPRSWRGRGAGTTEVWAAGGPSEVPAGCHGDHQLPRGPGPAPEVTYRPMPFLSSQSVMSVVTDVSLLEAVSSFEILPKTAVCA